MKWADFAPSYPATTPKVVDGAHVPTEPCPLWLAKPKGSFAGAVGKTPRIGNLIAKAPVDLETSLGAWAEVVSLILLLSQDGFGWTRMLRVLRIVSCADLLFASSFTR